MKSQKNSGWLVIESKNGSSCDFFEFKEAGSSKVFLTACEVVWEKKYTALKCGVLLLEENGAYFLGWMNFCVWSEKT